MKVRQEKTHAGCRMRREEEHPGRSRLLWAGLVLEAQAGARGAARAVAATLVHPRCPSGRMGQGREGAAPWGDPPAGAARAVGKTLIASPCENTFIRG